MNHKLANDMKMWKGNGNTATLLFSLKGLEMLHQEIREQVKTTIGILFRKSVPANKQHTSQSICCTGSRYEINSSMNIILTLGSVVVSMLPTIAGQLFRDRLSNSFSLLEH